LIRDFPSRDTGGANAVLVFLAAYRCVQSIAGSLFVG
jgi:hypothetical protein